MNMARRRRTTVANEAEAAAVAAASPATALQTLAAPTNGSPDPFADMTGTAPAPEANLDVMAEAAPLTLAGLDALAPDAGRAVIQQAVQNQHQTGDPAMAQTLVTVLGELSRIVKLVDDLGAKVGQLQNTQTQTVKLVTGLQKDGAQMTAGLLQEIREIGEKLAAGVVTASAPPSQPTPAATTTPATGGTDQQKAIVAPIVEALTERYRDPAFPRLSMKDDKHRVAVCQAAKSAFPALDISSPSHQKMVMDALRETGHLDADDIVTV
jgi:hypothetical protein